MTNPPREPDCCICGRTVAQTFSPGVLVRDRKPLEWAHTECFNKALALYERGAFTLPAGEVRAAQAAHAGDADVAALIARLNAWAGSGWAHDLRIGNDGKPLHEDLREAAAALASAQRDKAAAVAAETERCLACCKKSAWKLFWNEGGDVTVSEAIAAAIRASTK